MILILWLIQTDVSEKLNFVNSMHEFYECRANISNEREMKLRTQTTGSPLNVDANIPVYTASHLKIQ
jgi:hypothetical protein